MTSSQKTNPEIIVQATGLSKRFGKRHAVKGIDFVINSGECFGFLGPNGAGKTTTLKMILGVIEKTAGELRIFGLPVPEQIRKIKANIGVVPQNDNLDADLTVLENLLTYASYYNVPRSKALEQAAKLLHFFAMESRKDDIIGQLSGGQRRRLLLARALIHRPTLLILDEPTVGLDPQARYLIWERLQYLKEKGITIILTSHYMDEVARLSDRILIIDGGKIMATGKPQQMITDLVGLDVFEVKAEAATITHIKKEATACKARCEMTADTLLIYTHQECPKLDKLIRTSDQWLRRPANLEDLFIQITGRSLQE